MDIYVIFFFFVTGFTLFDIISVWISKTDYEFALHMFLSIVALYIPCNWLLIVREKKNDGDN